MEKPKENRQLNRKDSYVILSIRYFINLLKWVCQFTYRPLLFSTRLSHGRHRVEMASLRDESC